MFRRLPMIEFKSGFGNELPVPMIDGSPKRIVQPEGRLLEAVGVVVGAAVGGEAMLEGVGAMVGGEAMLEGVGAMVGVGAMAMVGVEAMVGVVGVVVLLKSLMSRSQPK